MKIYTSITSIYQNQKLLLETLKSISRQSCKPDMCFLYLSSEPYLKDIGFIDNIITNEELNKYIKSQDWIVLKWCVNTGPYRKLLNILEEKWNEDCVIITLDDDAIYNEKLIENLVNDYKTYDCCVNYRGFTSSRMLTNPSYDVSARETLDTTCLCNFATGVAGILYHPKFFHKTNNLIFDLNLIFNNCPTADDVWFAYVRIANDVKCHVKNYNWGRTMPNKSTALCENFNSIQSNTNTMINVLNVLKSKRFL